MKPFLKAVALGALIVPGLAHAQSWTYGGDRATAAPSISGQSTGSAAICGFEVVCYQGEWSLYLFTAISPETEDSPATIIVDGQAFPTRHGLLGSHGDQGIVLSMPIIDALKSGSRVEITFPTGGTPYRATFGLKGSSRALKAAEAGCAYPTPATAPERFRSASGESRLEAEAIAREILADDLAQMRLEASKPDIDQQGAWLIDLESGWRFLVVDVGFSSYHFGFSGYGTSIFSKPPNEHWRQVKWLVSGANVWIDAKGQHNGFPDMVLQNAHGVNQPLNLWTWNGQEYVHAKTIAP